MGELSRSRSALIPQTYSNYAYFLSHLSEVFFYRELL